MHGVLVFVTSMKNSMLNWVMLAHAFNPIILEAVSVSNTSLSLSARLYRYTEKLCLEIFFKKVILSCRMFMTFQVDLNVRVN